MSSNFNNFFISLKDNGDRSYILDATTIEITKEQIGLFNNVNKQKPSKIINSLLMIIFPLKILQTSSVFGNKCNSVTNLKKPNTEKEMLDPIKLGFIQGKVYLQIIFKKFKIDFKRSQNL